MVSANDPRSRRGATPPVASLPATFQVGRHLVRVAQSVAERWAVTVDDAALPNWYRTQAEAWEAGVREADRLDRPQPGA